MKKPIFLGLLLLLSIGASSLLHIQYDLPLREVKLYTINGSLLMDIHLEKNIEVSTLRPGLFILEIIGKDGASRKVKVVKE